MGAGSITSRLLGKGWKERADQYASSAVILGLVLGLLLMSVCFVWIDELVWLLGATPTIYPYALDYARYIIFGAPVMILAYILNNLLRWQGKANRSVIGLGFGGLLNIVLDPILIFTFDMGISGAAIASASAWLSWPPSLCEGRATSGSAPGSSLERPRCMETS